MNSSAMGNQDASSVYREAAKAALWMLVLNSLLSVSKGVVGWLGGSYALVADGLNNLSDVGLSIGMVLGMRWAGRPPDRRHAYGHGKIEQEVARIVGVVILATAGGIVVGALKQFGVRHAEPGGSVLVLAVLSMGVKEGMFRYVRRVARRLGSLALQADALNHRTDVGATLAVLLGTLAIWIGGTRWAFSDDVAAIFVGGFMGVGAARIVWWASRELLDEMPPSDILDAVRAAAARLQDDGALGIEKILGRKMGVYYVLDLHLEVPPDMQVREAHYLGHRVRDVIIEHVPSVSGVLVHVEPSQKEPTFPA